MKRKLLATALLAGLLAALAVGVSAGSAKTAKLPKGFFGIAPQNQLTPEDVEYMAAGGLESVRWPLSWGAVQPTRKGGYDWSGFDATVAIAARGGLEVLPVLGSPPQWATPKVTTLPIDNAKQRSGWKRFLRAAVERYGPGGEFWAEHAPAVAAGEDAIPRPKPIRNWQVGNEPNFFYFAFPVSPVRYAKFVTISSQAIKAANRSARVVLAGFFAEPTARGRRGMPATKFLEQVYRYPGIKRRFDAVSLHPYAVDSKQLERMVEEFHDVLIENRDRPALYITELGWGSQNNFKNVAFEQGPRGQVKQLRGSYRYLIANQRRLNLKGVYWFSWKDQSESCDFCDSVGFFREGERFKPKPAWRTFVGFTGGRPRP
jgi:hypothetical protein